MLTKKDMINALAKETGLPQAKAKDALEFIFNQLGESLATDRKLAIQGFGTFQLRERAPRAGRNPATGAALVIPAKTVVTFKASSMLADKIS